MSSILVTGGAGFIGSHLVDALVERGFRVRVLDSLEEQVHGPGRCPPAYLDPAAELITGDVGDPQLLGRALEGVDAVYHLASVVGVGQSMYEIARYVRSNSLATAVLLGHLANRPHSVKRLIVASSMSIYGEGAYICPSCGPAEADLRPEERLREGRFEPTCPSCGRDLRPVPTTEDKPLRSTSIYAITKRDQEEMALSIGRAYGLPTVAMRFFNVYGPRQALFNPYTGAAAIFASRALNARPPLIYEDGGQTRDFVHVSDVVAALLLVLERPEADYRAFNVGTGRPIPILQVAGAISELVGPAGLRPQVEGSYRKGDVRHCYPEISRLQELGYSPKVSFEEGVADLVEWVRGQVAEDRVDEAAVELFRRGLAQ